MDIWIRPCAERDLRAAARVLAERSGSGAALAFVAAAVRSLQEGGATLIADRLGPGDRCDVPGLHARQVEDRPYYWMLLVNHLGVDVVRLLEATGPDRRPPPVHARR